MKNKNCLLWVFLSACVLYGCIGGKSNVKNSINHTIYNSENQENYFVDDKDTVYLYDKFIIFVPGAIYNAIDKKYIINRNGFIIENKVWIDPPAAIFGLLAPATVGAYANKNAINAAKTWDYSINDYPFSEELTRHIDTDSSIYYQC